MIPTESKTCFGFLAAKTTILVSLWHRKGREVNENHSDEVVYRYLDKPDAYHSLEQRYVRACSRLASVRDQCAYLGILGMNKVKTPFQFAPGILLQEVTDPPTSTELHQAMSDWQNAGYVSHYSNVTHEIAVDKTIYRNESEQLWVARYVVYALRIRTLRNIFAPIFGNQSWSTIAAFKDRSIFASVVEPIGRVWTYTPQREVTLTDLEWVAANNARFVELWFGSKNVFRNAVEAFIDCPLQTSARMSTATLWSGIEGLIHVDQELRFRLAAYIASFLAPYGEERRKLFKQVYDYYNVRSKAVHGGSVGPVDFIVQAESAAVLLGRLLVKITEDTRIPTRDDLDRLLLGDGAI